VQKILFICKKNFSRSILAEAITNTMAPDRFRAYSAGLEDCGPLPEHLLAFLRSKGVATNRLKSKTFDYFTGLRAVQFDYVITTCDKATAEACPAWPGQPLRAHWDITRPDFDKGEGMGTAQMLERLYQRLYLTISLFVSLPEVRTGDACGLTTGFQSFTLRPSVWPGRKLLIKKPCRAPDPGSGHVLAPTKSVTAPTGFALTNRRYG